MQNVYIVTVKQILILICIFVITGFLCNGRHNNLTNKRVEEEVDVDVSDCIDNNGKVQKCFWFSSIARHSLY